MNSKSGLEKEFITRQSYNTAYENISILPNPDKVLKKIGKGIEAYRELLNDPHLWACVQSRKAGLISLSWEIEQNSAPENIYALINRVFSEFDVQQLERDILEAPLYGYQPLEIIWKFKQNYLLPEQIIAKPQEWFFFDNNGMLKFRAKNRYEGVELPKYKILLVQYEASYHNPYGHSLLSKCYWPIIFKNGGLKFWLKFTEKYGMPILIGQYTRGATQQESELLAETLANIVDDAVIVTPSDINIDIKEPVRASSANLYKELIKYCNAEVSKAILSQTLTTELDMGSYAAAQTHFKIRQEVVLSDIKLVENAMNKLIKWICELNFPTSAVPQFKIKSPAISS